MEELKKENEKTQEERRKLSEEEFREICKEAIPHIEALQNALKCKKIDNLASLAFDQSGYARFSIYDTGWQLKNWKNDGYITTYEQALEG